MWVQPSRVQEHLTPGIAHLLEMLSPKMSWTPTPGIMRQNTSTRAETFPPRSVTTRLLKTHLLKAISPSHTHRATSQGWPLHPIKCPSPGHPWDGLVDGGPSHFAEAHPRDTLIDLGPFHIAEAHPRDHFRGRQSHLQRKFKREWRGNGN